MGWVEIGLEVSLDVERVWMDRNKLLGNGTEQNGFCINACRGAANHSRVAEGTRPSPEGVYSGVS